MHKLESVLENKTHKILWDFEKTNRSPDHDQKIINNKKKRKKKQNLRDHRMKIKGSDKRDLHFDKRAKKAMEEEWWYQL